MAIRVKHPKDHPDVQASKEDDYKGKYYKDKKKSARRFADTVQTMMARKRSATEGSFRNTMFIVSPGLSGFPSNSFLDIS